MDTIELSTSPASYLRMCSSWNCVLDILQAMIPTRVLAVSSLLGYDALVLHSIHHLRYGLGVGTYPPGGKTFPYSIPVPTHRPVLDKRLVVFYTYTPPANHWYLLGYSPVKSHGSSRVAPGY
jgi:hypothetical protein